LLGVSGFSLVFGFFRVFLLPPISLLFWFSLCILPVCLGMPFTLFIKFSTYKKKNDSSLFLCKTSTSLVLLLVYVDDIVITGTDSTLIGRLKQNLQASFHMKDLGPL
jgi:hypothetical protein